MNNELNTMTVKSVAQFLKVSESWIYKNWKILGGRKLSGHLRFPPKEIIYEHLFSNQKGEEALPSAFHDEWNKVYKQTPKIESKTNTNRSKNERGGEKSETIEEGLKRHDLC